MVKGAGFYSDIGNNARDLIQNYQSDHKLPLATSTFDEMGGESFFRSVLSNMEAVYLKRNPTAKAVLELVRSDDNDQICYDHLAFRTFGVNGYGIDSIAKFFLDFGYTQKDELSFPEKKLKAYWFSPPSLSVSGDGSGVNGPLSRIFISELLVDQLSSQAQKIIQKCTEASVGGGNYAALASALGSLTWVAPLFSEFQELASLKKSISHTGLLNFILLFLVGHFSQEDSYGMKAFINYQFGDGILVFPWILLDIG